MISAWYFSFLFSCQLYWQCARHRLFALDCFLRSLLCLGLTVWMRRWGNKHISPYLQLANPVTCFVCIHHCLKHDQERVCAWHPNSISAFRLRSSVHLCWCGFFQYVYPDSLRMFENSCVGVASLCFCYWISNVLWNPAASFFPCGKWHDSSRPWAPMGLLSPSADVLECRWHSH